MAHPCILIHHIEILYRDTVVQDLYFLSYRRAKKFIEKNEKENPEFRWRLGGEPLWLW